MHQPTAASTANSGDASPQELFALTDEQILEIETASPAGVSAEALNAKPSENAAGLSPRATTGTGAKPDSRAASHE
jgi:hypothetical protein